jgi:hypothetical protein
LLLLRALQLGCFEILAALLGVLVKAEELLSFRGATEGLFVCKVSVSEFVVARLVLSLSLPLVDATKLVWRDRLSSTLPMLVWPVP